MFTAAVMNVHRDACRVRLWGLFFKIRGEPGGRNKGRVRLFFFFRNFASTGYFLSKSSGGIAERVFAEMGKVR